MTLTPIIIPGGDGRCRFCVTLASPLGWWAIDGNKNHPVCAKCCEQIKNGQSAIVDLFMRSMSYPSARLTELRAIFDDYKQNGIKLIEIEQ